jgi:hypothetical protein
VASGRLQVRTNGVAGAWADVPNSTATNRVVVPVDSANGSVFYRLAFP